MTPLEKLCEELYQQGIEVYEMPMAPRNKGLCGGNIVWINQALNGREKVCTLAEEQAHYATSAGNILNQSKITNRKQEKTARNLAYEKLIPLRCFVKASKEGIRNRYELAEFLDVTEEFLDDTLNHYREKYGLYVKWTSYIIYFEPLGVLKLFDKE
jgi:hypothetical protein